MKTTYVALADDDSLIRSGLANLIDAFAGFKVILQACLFNITGKQPY